MFFFVDSESFNKSLDDGWVGSEKKMPSSSSSSLLSRLAKKASSSSDASSSLNTNQQTKKKEITIPPPPPKVLKFTEMININTIKPYNSIENENSQHRSLDGKEKQVALTLKERKALKQEEHEKYMNKLKEYAADIKSTRKGEEFDVENNRYLSRKNELQKEMDQLTFEMKKFVYNETVKKTTPSVKSGVPDHSKAPTIDVTSNVDDKTKRKITRMMQEEYRAQGKDVSDMIEKKTHVNYKQFKELKKTERETERKEMKEQLKNGILDKKKIRKQKLMQQQRKQNELRKFYARHGAPNEIGETQAAFKSKYGKGGSVGKWQNGTLHIRRGDLYQLRGQNKRR